MAEGTFPKVDGDILFASESNRFNPKLIGQVQQAISVGTLSGTEFVTLGGSILYDASENFGQIMHVTTNLSNPNDSLVHIARLRFSGATANFVTGSNILTNPLAKLGFNFVLTSGALNDDGGNIGSPFAVFCRI